MTMVSGKMKYEKKQCNMCGKEILEGEEVGYDNDDGEEPSELDDLTCSLCSIKALQQDMKDLEKQMIKFKKYAEKNESELALREL